MPPAAQADASTPKAAAWMAGWLSLMLVIAVAGREVTRELAVFQVMEMRSIIGLLLLWPAIGNLTALDRTRDRTKTFPESQPESHEVP